jgi:small-conductance mechanosensitive channel
MMKATCICILAIASQQALPTLAALSSKSSVSSSMIAVESSIQKKFLDVFAGNADGDSDAEAKSEVTSESLAKKGADQKKLVKLWFTWGFWRLLVICAGVILLFAVVISPLALKLLGRKLLVAATVFFAQNFAFLCTAIAFATPGAAGAVLCLVLSVILCALSLLIFLGVVGWSYQGTPSRSIESLQHDLTYVFAPISIGVLVFLIIQGLVDSSGGDWGSIAMLASFLALGIAFAASGIIKDMMSYCFIRANEYFEEDEFIMNGGDILKVKDIFWCYTLAYNPKTRSDVYIPNSKLAGNAINNRSRDNSRTFEIDLDVPVAKVNKIVSDIMALMKKCDENGFTSLMGKKFDGQIDVAKSNVFVTAMDPGGTTCSIKIKLFGKYYFSKPPQWKMDTPEPEAMQRQTEWKAGWNYQIEWLLLEAKKVIPSE